METPASTNQFVPPKVLKTFPLLAGIFTMVTVAAAIWAMGQQERSGHVQTLSDGLNTCFARVGQSFTAKMIGDKNSEYLRNSFFANTEDCFGEVISFNRLNLAGRRDKQVGLALNQLSSEVHLFHEVLRPSVGFAQKENNLVPDRYAKLEQQKFNVDEALGGTRGRLNKYMARLRKVVGAGAFIVGSLSLLLLAQAHSKGKRRRELELTARQQLGEGHYGDISTIQRTIVQALELIETNYIARMAQMLFSNTVGTSVPVVARDVIERQHVEFARPVPQSGAEQKAQHDKLQEDQIEMIWEKFNREEEAVVETRPQPQLTQLPQLQSTATIVEEVPLNSVSDTLARAIDYYSSKLFSAGVLVQLDTDEVHTNIEHDLIETLVFEAFSEVMDGIANDTGHSLNISLKKIEGQAHFTIMRCSANWTPAEQDSHHVQIIRGLLEECGGEFSILDAKDSNNVLIGRNYRIQFPLKCEAKTTKDKQKRLTTVRKGKKRELMAQMN